MSIFSKGIETLDDLFVHQLQDIYYAEKQIAKSLAAMVEKVGNPQLKQDLAGHLQQTKIHIERLEKVFEMHDTQVKAVDCPAIDGILREADEVAGDTADFAVLDAALAAAAQAVEHYEIARYGTLVAWARQLGRNDCAAILRQTLEDEKAMDRRLTEVAETQLNYHAA
ncbi:YciE/YciF ferroxidase family protein [Labrys monachus]|uniref:Ferritin-like metal-binding protein YciE n=1 Tax=Labrys monachus TaxID=217067 RepID=A0ABU0FED0_9HYPH|nr:ferritin-like domain-containing protein [Labrys monachus]MDQ0392965.1 ferritin-like metal-binding protein YciE [Labrys monachus]